MTKDEIKNRISMALKDSILQQGFEIICKENEELKEEMNAKQVVLNDFKSRVETVTGRFNKKSSQLTKAKEIIKKFLDAKNIEDTCAAESEVEHFLQELSELQTVSIDWSIEESYVNGFSNGAKFGYNKANEWHYVKNGDLPKHEVNVLVLYDIQCIGIAHYNYDYKEWHFADSIVHDVIAWKEIVLPKGSE